MKRETKNWKKVMAGFRQITDQDRMRQGMHEILQTGSQALNALTLVRSEKTCVGEGESPSSLEARLPEFGTKVMNGKV